MFIIFRFDLFVYQVSVIRVCGRYCTSIIQQEPSLFRGETQTHGTSEAHDDVIGFNQHMTPP